MTIRQTHPQVAKLIETGLCLSKLKDFEEYKSKNRIVIRDRGATLRLGWVEGGGGHNILFLTNSL